MKRKPDAALRAASSQLITWPSFFVTSRVLATRHAQSKTAFYAEPAVKVRSESIVYFRKQRCFLFATKTYFRISLLFEGYFEWWEGLTPAFLSKS